MLYPLSYGRKCSFINERSNTRSEETLPRPQLILFTSARKTNSPEPLSRFSPRQDHDALLVKYLKQKDAR
jgi:hypothetical protein